MRAGSGFGGAEHKKVRAGSGFRGAEHKKVRGGLNARTRTFASVSPDRCRQYASVFQSSLCRCRQGILLSAAITEALSSAHVRTFMTTSLLTPGLTSNVSLLGTTGAGTHVYKKVLATPGAGPTAYFFVLGPPGAEPSAYFFVLSPPGAGPSAYFFVLGSLTPGFYDTSTALRSRLGTRFRGLTRCGTHSPR